jgi:hypothetical protein
MPIDILGGGYVVAPPSKGARSDYPIIEGSLDDLRNLPPLQHFTTQHSAEAISEGKRNDALWRHCMQQSRACDDFLSLLDVAETFNAQSLKPPLSSEEVVKTARSAWQKTEDGKNHFGQIGAFVTLAETQTMVGDPPLLALLVWLKGQNGPTSQFLIADGLAGLLGWSLPRLRRCRKALQHAGLIRLVRPPARGCAALYRWGPQSGNGLSISVGHALGSKLQCPSSKGEVLVEDSLSISAGHCQNEGGTTDRRASAQTVSEKP